MKMSDLTAGLQRIDAGEPFDEVFGFEKQSQRIRSDRRRLLGGTAAPGFYQRNKTAVQLTAFWAAVFTGLGLLLYCGVTR